MDDQRIEKTVSELIDELNSSITYMDDHQIKSDDKLPSNFEILMSGINGQAGMTSLFSPNIDKLISKLFELIINGDYATIMQYQDEIRSISDFIFGKGSFQGPISTTILNSLQNTMTSYKYNNTKAYLGKTLGTYKKIRLIQKNLKKDGKNLSKQDQEKYREALYAIKQILKFASAVYKQRKLVNRKVYNGVHNIIHEEEEDN